MKLSLCFTSCLLWYASQSQTTVCIIRGDSLFAGSTANSRIVADGKFNFVYDGPMDEKITAAIDKVAAVSKDFKSFSDSSTNKLRKIYTDTFTSIYRVDPSSFDKAMQKYLSVPVGRILLFGFENNKPILLRITFSMNKGIKHPVVVSAGTQEELEDFFTSSTVRNNWALGHRDIDQGGAWQLKKMIDLIANISQDGSGPPIDIMILTKQGKKWIRK